jgi:CubicO group peptidase (beta-lactamase class C family)
LQVHLGQRVNGIQLLTPASLEKIHTPDTRSITDESGTYRYGFGWQTAETSLGPALGHEGAFGGFYSRVGIIPSRNIAIFSATNELSLNAWTANETFTEAVIETLQKN